MARRRTHTWSHAQPRLNLLRRLFTAMDGYDHLFKLLLIGDAGVGKSRCGGAVQGGEAGTHRRKRLRMGGSLA